ncbi:MAG: hypothetical protein ROR55_02895 [Devosia sp.]
METKHTPPTHNAPEEVAAGSGARPTLTIDWTLYAEALDHAHMSEAEKKDLIEALWTIIVCFVDLGFDLAPDAEAEDALEKKVFEAATSAMVSSENTQTIKMLPDAADTSAAAWRES